MSEVTGRIDEGFSPESQALLDLLGSGPTGEGLHSLQSIRDRGVDPKKQPVDFEDVPLKASAEQDKILAEASAVPRRSSRPLDMSIGNLRGRARTQRLLDAVYPGTATAYQPGRLTAPGGGDVGAYARQHGNRGATEGVWTGERLSREYGGSGRGGPTPLALQGSEQERDAINTRDFEAWKASIAPKPEAGAWTPEGEHKERKVMLEAYQVARQEITEDPGRTQQEKLDELADLKRDYDIELYGLGWGSRPKDPKLVDERDRRPGESKEEWKQRLTTILK
jgi:hypothetical protein